jgi:hypothetical protein
MIHDKGNKNKNENVDSKLSGVRLVLDKLNGIIEQIISHKDEYVARPGLDFIRRSIISFRDIISLGY